MNSLSRFLSAAAPLLVAGMFLTGAQAEATSFSVPETTTLHPGDRVSLTILNHPELQVSSTLIDGSGRVAVPLIGLVPVANLTPTQADARIAARLSTYIREPAVDLALMQQGQNIFVSGGPGGVYPYTPGESLAVAISQIRQGAPGVVPTLATAGQPPAQNAAGSPALNTGAASPGAFGSVDLHHVVIQRGQQSFPALDVDQLASQGEPGPALQAGDTIVFTNKPIAVSVSGEVVDPTVAHLSTNEPLSEAVRQAGGTIATASSPQSAIGFELTRNGAVSYITSGDAAYRLPAQPGDKIYVPHSRRVGVVGMVVKPGDVVLAGDHSLVSALYYSGGPTKWANLKYVVVVHGASRQTYDISDLTHGTLAQNPDLADGDTVFVPEGHKIDPTPFFQAIYAIGQLRGL